MDAIREQLANQVVELEERLQGAMKAVDASARKVADLEEENDRLREGIKKARLYAGDNLPAGTGLSIIAMLEKALKGGA